MQVRLLSATPKPNLVCYAAMHQCYSPEAVLVEVEKRQEDGQPTFFELSENELGKRIVKKCIEYGHWSIVEHAYFTFNAIDYPHDVIVQARTHRHLSFSVQSQRYTYQKPYDIGRILNDGSAIFPRTLINDAFYFRPYGEKYFDREGNKYTYTQEMYENDLKQTALSCQHFARSMDLGLAPEHARQMLTQNLRQHFVVSCNARALLHFCDLRLPKNAQLEIRHLAGEMFKIFSERMPEVAEWYSKNRKERNKLAP